MDNKTLVDDDTNTNVLHANALENDSKSLLMYFLAKQMLLTMQIYSSKLTNQCK